MYLWGINTTTRHIHRGLGTDLKNDELNKDFSCTIYRGDKGRFTLNFFCVEEYIHRLFDVFRILGLPMTFHDCL